jgi:hypothetical protein
MEQEIIKAYKGFKKINHLNICYFCYRLQYKNIKFTTGSCDCYKNLKCYCGQIDCDKKHCYCGDRTCNRKCGTLLCGCIDICRGRCE